MNWTIIKNQNRTSELKHYGVLGMKWGVRKDRTKNGKFGSSEKIGEITRKDSVTGAYLGGADGTHKYSVTDYKLLKEWRDMTGTKLLNYYTNQQAGDSIELGKALTRGDLNALLDEKYPGLGSTMASPGYIKRAIEKRSSILNHLITW